MTIRTLIVDDEAHARARIRHALKDEPDFALVGECAKDRGAKLLGRPPEPSTIAAMPADATSVAQTSKSAVSQVSKLASRSTIRAVVELWQSADLEIGDTAFLATCATGSQAPQVVVMSATEASQAGLPLPTVASAKTKCC